MEGINKSHFIGAAYGMERMMGHADTPEENIHYASYIFPTIYPLFMCKQWWTG